jgi:hypothetical protein
MGPVDMAGAVLPLAHLGGLNKSLDYVTGLLKDAGYGAEAASPATRALSEAFQVPEAMPSMAQHAATSRVTGRVRPYQGFMNIPPEMEFAPGFKRGPQNLNENEQIWRSWNTAQKKIKADPRFDERVMDFPEVRQIEQAPTAQSFESLKDVPVGVEAQMKEQAPLIQTQSQSQRGKVDRSLQRPRVAASKATPEQIRAIQEAAGSGQHTGTSLAKQFPDFTESAIRAILKMPWK